MDMVADQILWPQRQGHDHHGVLWQAIEQRKDVVTGGVFAGYVADLRRTP